MSNNEKSPAVVSMEAEQERQRTAEAKGDLESGLEDTFPASDPVSMISTGVPSGRTDPDEAAKVHSASNPYTADKTRSEGQPEGLIADGRKLIREHPLAAVGVVAVAAFFWGATR